MIKYLFILINSLSLFIYSLFGGDGGITVTSTIPTSMKPGSEVAVEIKITKGNQSGFAKMQLELPAGLTAKEIDNKGANFSFTDGIAKWVWASLPAESDIILKVTLVADAASSGQKIVVGKYSYVENNGKQVVEMNPVEINFNADATANATPTASTGAGTDTSTPTNTTASNTNTETPITGTVTTPNTNAEPVGNVKVARTIERGNVEGEYIIHLKVNKGLTKGFARYSDDVPADINAKAGKTEGASFSVSDGKIKFVWVAVPEKEELELSYILTGVNKSIFLNGEYSYLEENQSKKYLLSSETITVTGSEPVANTKTVTPENTNTVAVNTNTVPENTNTVTPETTNTVTPETTNTVAVNTNTTPVETKTETPIETLPKNEGNVNYMVQIGAFTNSAVSGQRLARIFRISEKISSEMNGGYSKFMVGAHPEYKNARDHREKMRNNNKVASAFVVAYNTGKRITVQEALMISNQKWFK